MSDIEHELLGEIERAGDRSRRLAELAHRALLAAREAQDARDGRHEPWIDDALAEIGRELAAD
jgi:hypothetical protein